MRKHWTEYILICVVVLGTVFNQNLAEGKIVLLFLHRVKFDAKENNIFKQVSRYS